MNGTASIYLDNSATTALSPAAAARMAQVYEQTWGNPSSVHAMGLAAAHVLAQSRAQLLIALGLKPGAGELIFGAGGTEADNLALIGTAHAKARLGGSRIIITDSEHPAVTGPAAVLEHEGFEVVRLSTKGGVIHPEELDAAINDRTLLLSIMTVNNETGAAYNIKELFAAAKRKKPDLITHTDAVQGFLKLPVPLSDTGADLITVSSHKIHGPKGVGALYVAAPLLRAKRLTPVLFGGGQENGLRSGTENLPGIAGFAAAAEEGYAALAASLASMAACRARLAERRTCDPAHTGIVCNTPAGAYVPHIISLTMPHIRSEVMLRFLSGEGIYVSSGSACSSHAHGPSGVLLAFGLDRRAADQTIRISISRETTETEIDTLCDALAAGLARLARV